MGTAGLVLAIMIIPFIVLGHARSIPDRPGRLKESAYALGSTRWEVIWDIARPIPALQ